MLQSNLKRSTLVALALASFAGLIPARAQPDAALPPLRSDNFKAFRDGKMGERAQVNLKVEQVTRQGDKFVVRRGDEEVTATGEQLETYLRLRACEAGSIAAEITLDDPTDRRPYERWKGLLVDPAYKGKSFLVLKSEKGAIEYGIQQWVRNAVEIKVLPGGDVHITEARPSGALIGSEVLPLSKAKLVVDEAIAQVNVKGCETALKSLATGLEMYASDHSGHYPPKLETLLLPWSVDGESGSYFKTLPVCPVTGKCDYQYRLGTKPDSFRLSCQGDHSAAYYRAGRPAYDAEEGLIGR